MGTNVRKELTDILCELKGGEKRSFQDDDPIVTIYHMDSMDIIQLIIKIEQQFQIEVFDEDLDVNEINRFGALVNVIEERI